jgi:PAS domain S-box-containing protein
MAGALRDRGNAVDKPITGGQTDVRRFGQSELLVEGGTALAAGDTYFRRVLDILPAAVYVTDALGVITYYNEAAAELWGRRPELGTDQWCGSWKLWWPDGRPMPLDQCPMAMTLRTERPVRGAEAIAERPNGTRIPFIPYPMPLLDPSGRLIGGINLLVDITDRKREEEAALRLASIVESSDDAIISKDLDGVVTSWNRGAEQLFGRKFEDAMGKPTHGLVPAELWAEERSILERVRRGEQISHYQTIRRREDGGLIDVSLTVSPVKNAADQVIGTSEIARDITERRHAEQVAQHLAAIVSSSDDAILTKDLDGIITSWNQGAERLFGYTAREAVGRPITILIPADLWAEEPKILSRIRAGERVQHYETMRQRKDGSLVDISLTVSPVRDASGKIVGASKVARDITGLRRAQEQQQLLLREMNHRVKNLFHLAGSVVSLSARSARTPGELANSVGERLAALARAHSLTITKPSDAANEIENPATLHALIKAIASPYETRTGECRERIEISGDDVRLSETSITSLALLLHEFATNAAKYGALSTSDGTVEVHCREDDDRFVLLWRERGGPQVDHATNGEGFGSRLTQTAVRGLGGTIARDWAAEGLTIELSVARDRLVGP